jgi:hypothetical protein
LDETLDTQLRFGSTYHPQIERVNQNLKDLLRAYVLQYRRSCDKSLPYAEFSYNNSYQVSLKMAPFEVLYGRRSQTLLFCSDTGERKVFRPDVLQEANVTPGFKAKPNAHSMCAQESSLHTYHA